MKNRAGYANLNYSNDNLAPAVPLIALSIPCFFPVQDPNEALLAGRVVDTLTASAIRSLRLDIKEEFITMEFAQRVKSQMENSGDGFATYASRLKRSPTISFM